MPEYVVRRARTIIQAEDTHIEAANPEQALAIAQDDQGLDWRVTHEEPDGAPFYEVEEI